MAEDDDESSKTEDPTPKRLEDARKRGQVVNSREVTNFLMISTLGLIIFWLLPYSCAGALGLLRVLIENIHNLDISGDNLYIIITKTVNQVFLYTIAPLTILIFIAILSSFLQQGQFNISSEPIVPKLNKISPISGLKRMFSLKSIVEFLKGIVKISIVGIILYLTIMTDIKYLLSYIHSHPFVIIEKVYEIINHLMLYICIFLFIIAVADFTYQKFEHIKSLRMTKQEVKDEFKEIEGNPEIKQKIRRLRAERAQNRIATEVPKADVVITNPTHFSIALKYDSETMQAPLLVSKGMDDIALRIREIAKEHDIPLVENKPLARALFDNVEIGDEIPVEHYEAVAAVISYVYKLKKKKL